MEGECPHEPPRRGNGGRVSPRAAGTGNGGRVSPRAAGTGNGGRVSPRAAFRCAEGWFHRRLRSAGRGKRLLARGRADARPSRPAAVTPLNRGKSLRLRVSALKKRSTLNVQLSTLNVLRAWTPALPTAHARNTHSTRMAPVANRLRTARFTRRGFLLSLAAAMLCRQRRMRVCRLDDARVRQMAKWAG